MVDKNVTEIFLMQEFSKAQDLIKEVYEVDNSIIRAFAKASSVVINKLKEVSISKKLFFSKVKFRIYILDEKIHVEFHTLDADDREMFLFDNQQLAKIRFPIVEDEEATHTFIIKGNDPSQN